MRQFFSVLLTFFFLQTAMAADPSSGGTNTPTFRLTGDAELTSHFVHHGLSYTDKDPGLNAGFYFNFGPQFKFGFSGANVKFDDTHIWLTIKGIVKIDFSQNVVMNLYYANHRFYKNDARNGNTLGTNMSINGYIFTFDMDSNWEGTAQGSQYVAFSKEFQIPWQLFLIPSIGYTMQKTSTYSNYFDAKLGLMYKTQHAGNWELAGTYNSNASQFDGRGDTFFFLSAQFEF